jgi:hypothetical protein
VTLIAGSYVWTNFVADAASVDACRNMEGVETISKLLTSTQQALLRMRFMQVGRSLSQWCHTSCDIVDFSVANKLQCVRDAPDNCSLWAAGVTVWCGAMFVYNASTAARCTVN